MKNSPLYSANDAAGAKQDSVRTQCCLQRIKATFKLIAKRKASNRHIRELWYTGCVR